MPSAKSAASVSPKGAGKSKQRKADASVTKLVQAAAVAAQSTTDSTTDNNNTNNSTENDAAVSTGRALLALPAPRESRKKKQSAPSESSPSGSSPSDPTSATPSAPSSGQLASGQLGIVPPELVDGTVNKGPRPDGPFVLPVQFHRMLQKMHPDDGVLKTKVGLQVQFPYWRPGADAEYNKKNFPTGWVAIRCNKPFNDIESMVHTERGYVRHILSHAKIIYMIKAPDGKHPSLLLRDFTGVQTRSPDGVADGTLTTDDMIIDRAQMLSRRHYFDEVAHAIKERKPEREHDMTVTDKDDDDGAAVEPREIYRIEAGKLEVEKAAAFLDSVRRSHHLESEKEAKKAHMTEPRPNSRPGLMTRFAQALGGASQDSDSATDVATNVASDSDDDDRRTLDSAPLATGDIHDVFGIQPKRSYIEGNGAFTVNLTVTEAQLLRTKFGLAAMRIGSVVTYDKTRAKQYLNIRWVGAVTSDSNGKKITPTKRVREFVAKMTKTPGLSTAEVYYIGYGNLRLKFDSDITSDTIASLHGLMRDGSSDISHLRVFPDVHVHKPSWANVKTNVPQKQRTKFEQQSPVGIRRRVTLDTPMQLRDMKRLAEMWGAVVVNEQSSPYSDISSYIFEWQRGADVEQYEGEEGHVVRYGTRSDQVMVVEVHAVRQGQRQ